MAGTIAAMVGASGACASSGVCCKAILSGVARLGEVAGVSRG